MSPPHSLGGGSLPTTASQPLAPSTSGATKNTPQIHREFPVFFDIVQVSYSSKRKSSGRGGAARVVRCDGACHGPLALACEQAVRKAPRVLSKRSASAFTIAELE